MKRTPHRLASLVVAIAAGIATIAAIGTSPASADALAASPVQAQINQHLAAYPGGKQINATEVSYAGGRFVITFARPAGASTLVTADCPWNWFCFYDNLDFGYPRGKLSDCGWQDLYWWGWQDRTESAYYNMPSGSVAFIDHAGGTGHSNDPTLFTLSTSKRSLAQVPYPNRADHVNRSC